MDGMSAVPSPPSVLPFVAGQPLVDHHCHGVLRAGGDLAGLLNEADGDATADGMPFDSLAGLALRRWCPPLLGLAAHASVASYQERRAALGADEVNRRFLGASGLTALCVDTGYTPADLLLASGGTTPLTPRVPPEGTTSGTTQVPPGGTTLGSPQGPPDGSASLGTSLAFQANAPGMLSPGETAGFAGAAAFEVVRLEQVAESLARSGVRAADFPDEYRKALSERVTSPSFGIKVVGLKSIAAYRVGLELDGPRPGDGEVVAAVSRWLGGTNRAGRDDGDAGTPPRLADEVLHRFFIWCGADLGLPIQFHVGYGDRDVDLHRCNPLLLTGLLRALEPTGVPVVLLHNYPYHREAGYLAQVFPLVHADLGLATHNVGARSAALLGEALELVPLRKFLFSSDAFGLPELYYLGTLLFRRALSAFLSERLAADDLSYSDAERITRLIGAENARRAYRLD